MTAHHSVSSIKGDLGDQVQAVMARYPKRRSAIMPALDLAQEKYGIVDGETYQAIAEMLDVPEIWVFEVASFYSLYNRSKLGEFHIQLCTNVSCMLLGAYDLMEHLRNRFSITEGATTDDGLVTLSSVECIGACDQAPVMMINDTYHNNLTTEKLDDILDPLLESVQEGAL